ncbi:MAG TPA: nickel-binding protein [Gaiellaceae bacterium]|nr:nickel-binding protein [Gaiellaceae bacterium]
MAEFLVEQYVARSDLAAVERGAGRAHRTAEEMSREGIPVVCLRSFFAPEEETCFYLYEAGSVEVVREAARRAALPSERVTEVVSQGG